MKKFIVSTATIVLVTLLVPTIIVSSTFNTAPQFEETFYGGLKIKRDRLISLKDEKKVVIIGGSSAAFGIRSDILEEEVGLPIVNFGLYANLGTKVMVDLARKYINKDDIVLIQPEQNSQALSMYFNGEAMWYAADSDYKMLKDLPSSYNSDLFNGFFKYSSQKFNYSIGEGYRAESVYTSKNLNKYGDFSLFREKNTMAKGYDSSTLITFENEIISTDFIEFLNKFNEEVSKKGATTYYSFAPMNALAVKETDEANIDTYASYIYQELNFDFIGNPRDSIIKENYFYDSNFHLNTNGAIKYTLDLAKRLKFELKDFSKLKNEYPSMPSLDIKVFDGEELEYGDFVYTVGGDELEVTRLSEEGKTKSSLVIEDTYLDKKIVSFADGLFKDNLLLKSITINKNLNDFGALPFEGCSNLETIKLTNSDPDYLHSPTNLLDDSPKAKIYVPNESLESYKNDYFWSKFADRIFGY